MISLKSLYLIAFFIGNIGFCSTTLRTVRLSREFVVGASLPFSEGFVYGSSLQCVKNCTNDYVNCFSVMYWKNERKCKILYSSYPNIQSVAHGDVAWYILKDTMSYTHYPSINAWLVYRHGNKNWDDARDACAAEPIRSRLFKVDNSAKQDIARKLAENSGKDRVMIGVYCTTTFFPLSFNWKYIDGSPLLYKEWGFIFEPKFPTYAALSSFSNYKWEAVDGLFLTGGWICERY